MSTAIRTRKPTGVVPFPLMLVEGAEKSGKTYAAALLSTSPRVGQTYWIDLGEGSGDEYGAIKGARFLIVEHDGTYHDVLAQVLAVKAEAERVHAAGEPPVVLVIDTMTDWWDGLKDWATERAKGSKSNRAKLAVDPNAEIKVTGNYWNDASSRHNRLMNELHTFPGVVVLTARGGLVAAVENGQFVEGKKVYRVEGQKDMASHASVWVRMHRDAPAELIGGRSVKVDMRERTKDPEKLPDVDNLLDWVVFEGLGCNPATARVRDIKHLTGGELTDEERGAEAPNPVVVVGQKIQALIAEHKWDRAVIERRFVATYKVPPAKGSEAQLAEFLSELQQDVAVEAEQEAADAGARDEAAAEAVA